MDFSTVASTTSMALADKYIELKGASSPEDHKKFNEWNVPVKAMFLA